MSAAHEVEALLMRLGSTGKGRLASADLTFAVPVGLEPRSLALCWPGLNDVLPDGGFPSGVVELATPRALGGSTSVALAGVRAGQARAKSAWCAWIDPEKTLHAPGVVAAGVDLARMLVVCPPRAQLARVAVKVVGAEAFEVVVVDFDTVATTTNLAKAPEVLVRKLALAAESSGTTVLLLTDSSRQRPVPLPVALRLELSRPDRCELAVRVVKDRRGRVGLAKTIPFQPVMRAAG